MKSIYVKDIRKNDFLTDVSFAVQEFERLQTKDGKPYNKILLTDRTGSITGFVWSDNIANIDRGALTKGGVVSIDAKVEEFKNALQLNIQRASKVSEQYIEDFIEGSQFKTNDLWEKLESHIAKIKDESIKKLIDKLFADEEIKKKFMYSPAAEYVHHGFQSGLLEHVVEMLDIAHSIEDYYKDANFDLVRCGIIFHDIGKIYELAQTGVVTYRTTEGYLLGHLIIGFELLLKFATGVVDDKTLLALKHIVISHHGEFEFGSPIKPATMEAMIVYHVDVMSSQVRTMDRAKKSKFVDDQGFTEFDRIVGSKVYTL